MPEREIRPQIPDDAEPMPELVGRLIMALLLDVACRILREPDRPPGGRGQAEVRRRYLVIDLFYPPREQGFLALVDFEGPVIGPSVDHAFVVVDPAAEVDAQIRTVLSLELGP